MCSSLYQLAPGSRDLSQAEKWKNCCVKGSKNKITIKIVLDEQSCQVSGHSFHFVNLLSFTKQLLSSQLEINHVIQEPTEVN